MIFSVQHLYFYWHTSQHCWTVIDGLQVLIWKQKSSLSLIGVNQSHTDWGRCRCRGRCRGSTRLGCNWEQSNHSFFKFKSTCQYKPLLLVTCVTNSESALSASRDAICSPSAKNITKMISKTSCMCTYTIFSQFFSQPIHWIFTTTRHQTIVNYAAFFFCNETDHRIWFKTQSTHRNFLFFSLHCSIFLCNDLPLLKRKHQHVKIWIKCWMHTIRNFNVMIVRH